MAGMYVGVVSYADDLILLAPTKEAAQRMLQTCEVFTKASNITFNSNNDFNKSKSKAIYAVGPRGAACPDQHSCSGVASPYHGRRGLTTWDTPFIRTPPWSKTVERRGQC